MVAACGCWNRNYWVYTEMAQWGISKMTTLTPEGESTAAGNILVTSFKELFDRIRLLEMKVSQLERWQGNN